jgi:hypothetical protein
MGVGWEWLTFRVWDRYLECGVSSSGGRGGGARCLHRPCMVSKVSKDNAKNMHPRVYWGQGGGQ